MFATSLMNGLGLSKGAVYDGFPMLHHIFDLPSLMSAMTNGFQVDPRRWPLKDGYPAIASKRAQVLTYSMAHFMVSTLDLMKYDSIRNCLSNPLGYIRAHGLTV